jgi:hypothetical protein
MLVEAIGGGIGGKGMEEEQEKTLLCVQIIVCKWLTISAPAFSKSMICLMTGSLDRMMFLCFGFESAMW